MSADEGYSILDTRYEIISVSIMISSYETKCMCNREPLMV
jgi:hypothetical protein